MERSWDYLLKSPMGFFVAALCSLVLLAFIVAGGLFMRMELEKQRREREAAAEAKDDSDVHLD